MSDDRSIAVKHRWLALAALPLVVMMACGRGGAPAPEGDMAASMETAAVDTGPTSDLVERRLPNPNPTVILDWAPLPDGRGWGSTAGIDIGPDGHVWAYDRCGGGLGAGCENNPDLDPIFKFDKDTGEILTSFGAGLFVTPHGFHVDSDGNVWVTDFAGNDAGTKGHQVIKFSPEGEVLLRLGEAGVAGSGPGQLNQPCDVITAPNGDIFVSDGHSGQGADPPPGSTGRILKFDSEGNFIKEWGEIGFRPGQFRTPHAMEFDSQGRLYVADRGNHRIQIFDQEGEFLAQWTQFGRPSGIFFDDHGRIFVADSESDDVQNPGWEMGIRIGEVATGWVTEFILYPWGDPREVAGNGAEFVAVDRDGNLYGGEPRPRRIQKYIRVRP